MWERLDIILWLLGALAVAIAVRAWVRRQRERRRPCADVPVLALRLDESGMLSLVSEGPSPGVICLGGAFMYEGEVYRLQIAGVALAAGGSHPVWPMPRMPATWYVDYRDDQDNHYRAEVVDGRLSCGVLADDSREPAWLLERRRSEV